MRAIAFVTCKDFPDLAPDDRLMIEPLKALGLKVHAVDWQGTHFDWNAFDSIVVRSTWDYHIKYESFLNWVRGLKVFGAKLWNPADVILQNANKTYLRELGSLGVATVPTLWVGLGQSHVPGFTSDGAPKSKESLFDLLSKTDWKEAVLKPTVAASARDTYRFKVSEAHDFQEHFDKILKNSGAMIQPYFSEVESEGEWSLIFFNKKFSHAVRKFPASGDFRVQKEHGGRVEAVHQVPADLISQATEILKKVKSPLLYARVDGVVRQKKFFLMELELIEPALFLTQSQSGIEAFAQAIALCSSTPEGR